MDFYKGTHQVAVNTLLISLLVAKGRTNIELREQFVLAEGVSQSMAHFVSKSKSQSKGSPSTSTGSQSSTVSWSGRSASSASGPITKVRTLPPAKFRETYL